MRRRILSGVTAGLVAATIAVVHLSPARADVDEGAVTLISATLAGEPGDGESRGPLMTPSGRFVSFYSYANLIGHQSVHAQAYLYDRQAGTMEIVSRNSAGEYGDGNSIPVDISDDGRFVLLISNSTNFPGEPGIEAGYLRDRETGTLTLINDETPSAIARYRSMSGNADIVVYDVPGSGLFVYRRSSGVARQLLANAIDAAVSADGRYVIYRVDSSSGEGTIYRYDVLADQSSEILADFNVAGGAFLSRDGSRAIFFAKEPELGEYSLYVADLDEGQLDLIAANVELGSVSGGHMSDDGRYVSYFRRGPPRDYIVYQAVRADLVTGEHLVVDSTVGKNPHFALSADGNQFSFASSRLTAPSLLRAQVFVANLAPGDSTPPTLGSPGWSENPKALSQVSTLTVAATDSGSGISGGEYFIGETDPGQGQGIAMNWNGTLLSAAFGANIEPGVYRINIRAVDNARNWSTFVVDYLVVYNPDGPSITGRRTITPTLASGDVLPGLISSDQNDSARFAFTVRYNNQGAISNNSDMMFDYNTGTRCNNPNHAANCHSLALNATSIFWLAIGDTNNSQGTFQGTARLVIDGTTTTNPFRVVAVGGGRWTPQTDDHFVLKIYAPGANPNTSEPLYQVSQSVLKRNIRIR